MKTNFPFGYQQVMPYLIITNASGFIDFMKEVFGATERMRHMRDENIIAHGEVAVGDSVIMFADATPTFDPHVAGLFVYVDNADATYDKALKAGAKPIMPVSDQPYGRSGGVEDPFGNTWWITTDVPAKPEILS